MRSGREAPTARIEVTARWHKRATVVDGWLRRPHRSRRRRSGNAHRAAMSDCETVKLDPHAPDPGVIKHAAAILRAGGLVAFPTETVYGLGADGLNPAAVERIFAAKGRPAEKGLILHLATFPELE